MAVEAESGAEAPFLVTWELTRACALRCQHCRADAVPGRNPGELGREAVVRVLEGIAASGPRPPLMIFTGGDPLERPDLDAILSRSVELGVPTAVAPSVTPRLTDARLARWAALGVRTVSVSLDGPSPEVHDRFRGVPGTFAASVAAARAVVRNGMQLQVNTSVCRETVAGLPRTEALVRELGASRWELFFVVPTGRAVGLTPLGPDETEAALRWLAGRAREAPYRATTVAAPQYRRVREEVDGRPVPTGPVIKEGRGFVSIDHLGNVAPNGYLPLSAGNVRTQSLLEVYRSSPLFRALRDPSRLRGRCAACRYRERCGGSRARAYAMTGDVFAEDPACPYVPSPSLSG